MRHRGTKTSKPARFGGYGWYDRATGRIDLHRLALEATREAARSDAPAPLPAWMDGFPAIVPGARPVDLARLEARARRAFVLHAARSVPD